MTLIHILIAFNAIIIAILFLKTYLSNIVAIIKIVIVNFCKVIVILSIDINVILIFLLEKEICSI